MNFHVGQKVVCVDDNPHYPQLPWTPPQKGAVYTITSLFVERRLLCVTLAELQNKNPVGRDFGYVAHRFRPLRVTNIDVFLKMLEPQPKEKVESV
jgi:hypothetical protein